MNSSTTIYVFAVHQAYIFDQLRRRRDLKSFGFETDVWRDFC